MNLYELHNRGAFAWDDVVRPIQRAEYRPGRLVLFLAQSLHRVTALRRGRRVVLFMWFHCRRLSGKPQSYRRQCYRDNGATTEVFDC